MHQRDLLRDQIEQAGKVLAKALYMFLGLSDKHQPTQAMQLSQQVLKEGLDLDLDALLALDKAKLKAYLVSRKLIDQHLEVLSQYLRAIALQANASEDPETKLYLEKAIDLLDIADEVSGMLSFERIHHKLEIEKLLIPLK